MVNRDYHKSFTARITPKEAFEKIADVAGWWTRTFKGKSTDVGDRFGVTFGKTTVDFKVKESSPYKRLVWEVTDCHLDWLKNKTEWTGTSVVWEISGEMDSTRVDMTHAGLVPGLECYKDCEAGWNEHAGGSLPKFMAGEEIIPVEGSRRR